MEFIVRIRMLLRVTRGAVNDGATGVSRECSKHTGMDLRSPGCELGQVTQGISLLHMYTSQNLCENLRKSHFHRIENTMYV